MNIPNSPIIFQTDTMTYATIDPTFSPYDADAFFGTIWINKTTKKQYLGTETGFESIDPSDGMVVNRSGLTLTSADASPINIINDNGLISANGQPIGGLNSGSLSDMLAISSPSDGEQFLLKPDNIVANRKMCFFNGESWQVQGETFQIESKTALAIGQIVEPDLVNAGQVRKATGTGDRDIIGIVVFKAATGAGQQITVATTGRWEILCQGGSYIPQLNIKVAVTDGIGQGTTMSVGCFARPLENVVLPAVGGGLLKCLLYSVKR